MMMTNLFSIFDPTLSILSLPLVFPVLLLLLVPTTYWMTSLIPLFLGKFSSTLDKEVKYVLPQTPKGVLPLTGTMFLLVSILNFTALFPHLFSLTSHLVWTMPLALSFWLATILFTWSKSLSDFLSHLVPNGTPLGLISFMSVVELLSNLIRPLALTFRLTANMMAGHLLMSLIGGAVLSLPGAFVLVGCGVQSMLVVMELGVSLIQSYVFSTLIVLYISESN